MFAAIAPSYDLNNRLHSLWRDQAWRRTAVKAAAVQASDTVLDVACGTGDLTLCFADRLRQLLGSVPAGRLYGVDFTYEMLPPAVQKSTDAPPIAWLNGDAQALPVADQSVNVVSIAFGIRNVADPRVAFDEFYRVLRPGGRAVILEFSLPENPLLRRMYNLYFRHVLPRTATWISGDRTGAYKYLPESVNTFIDRKTMMQMLADCGFSRITQKTLTFGVCICYSAEKTV